MVPPGAPAPTAPEPGGPPGPVPAGWADPTASGRVPPQTPPGPVPLPDASPPYAPAVPGPSPPYPQSAPSAGGDPLPGPEGIGGGLISTQPAARPQAKKSPLKALAIGVLLLAAGGLGVLLYKVVTAPPAEVAGGAGGTVSGDPTPGQEKPKARKTKPKTPGNQKPEPKTKPKTDPTDKPKPDPGPQEKPKPKEKVEPAEKPVEKPKPPPIDAAKQAALKQALADVRVSLSQRDLAEAQRHLDTADANVQTPEDRAAVGRLRTLRGHLEQFWEGIRKSVEELESGEELIIGDSRVAVVEATRERLIIKAGVNRVFRIEELPTSLVLVLAQRWFAKEPSSKVFLGAFLAFDPKGDRQRARQLWQEAGRSGLDVQDLLPELDEPGPAGPSGGSASVQKTAPPADAAKLRQAKTLVRQTYKKEYDKADTALDKFLLARKLLEDAPGTDDNPEARYVMFCEARDLAVAAGKAKVACEAIDGMARFYTVDPLKLKVEALSEAAEVAKTLSGNREIARSGLALVQPAIEAKRLDEAGRLAKLSAEAAKKARNAPMIKEARSFQEYIQTLKGQ